MSEDVKKMKPTTILAKCFRKDGQSLSEFVAELKHLTQADKDELVPLGAKYLGVEVDTT